jgi:MFS family permease
MAILSALLGGVVGFFAMGFGAASVLTSALGSRDGGPAMSGFFGFGPIGGIAGALLGVGLVLRFAGGSAGWGKGLLIAAGALLALGGILLVASLPNRGPAYSYIIEFQLEYPAAILTGVNIPSSDAMWGAAGDDLDDKPISQFFEKSCTGETCVIGGAVAALGPMTNFHIAVALGQKKYHYPLDVPAVVNGALDWSEWRPGEGARCRWRIVQRNS